MLTASFEDLLRQIVREELEKVVERLLAARPATGGDDFLTKTQAAALAAVSPATIDKWKAAGLKVQGEGRNLRIARADLLAFIARPRTSENDSVKSKAIALFEKGRRLG